MRSSRSRWVGILVLVLVALPCDAQQTPGATIAPGDRIALKIWNEPEMSDTFQVAETGEVVLPKLGVVRVADRSAGELRDSLRRAYAEFLRNPAVEITLLRRISVIGEVRAPDLYLVDPTMTLREVIARAGGVTPTGNPRRIEIIRGGETMRVAREEVARFPATELLSGDQVVVGRRSWFEINSLAIASTAAVVVSVMIPVLQSVFGSDES